MGEGIAAREDLRREFAASDRGREITITRKTAGTYDQTTGTATQTEESYPGRGRVGDYADRQIDGTLIRRGDRRVTWLPDVENESFVPRESDIVSFGDEIATVVSVKVRELGDEWFAYTLQIRR